MRKNIIAGNWKMNYGPVKAVEYFEELIAILKNENDVIASVKEGKTSIELYVPSISLQASINAVKNLEYPVKIGAENINAELSGAYTGEISATMLKEISVNDTIIGHSERRHIYNESNADLNKKVHTAINEGLNVVYCVGELLEDRTSEKTIDVVKEQIIEGLKDIKDEEMDNICIAYEPVWAIGTGKTASSKDAQEVCCEIRKIIADIYSEEVSEKLHVLYGGSVKPNNTKELLSQNDIDGLLIGGASLKPDVYAEILKNSL